MQIQHQEFSFHLTVHPCDCRLPILGSWKLLPDLCVWSIIPFDFFLVLVSDQAFGIFMLQCLDHFAWQCSIPLPFWCFSCCHLRVHPWLQETLACSPAVRAARTWVCSLTPWLSVKHGSLNVTTEHHPTMRYLIYNCHSKVMSNSPKMGHLPIPVKPVRWVATYGSNPEMLWYKATLSHRFWSA